MGWIISPFITACILDTLHHGEMHNLSVRANLDFRSHYLRFLWGFRNQDPGGSIVNPINTSLEPKTGLSDARWDLAYLFWVCCVSLSWYSKVGLVTWYEDGPPFLPDFKFRSLKIMIEPERWAWGLRSDLRGRILPVTLYCHAATGTGTSRVHNFATLVLTILWSLNCMYNILIQGFSVALYCHVASA